MLIVKEIGPMNVQTRPWLRFPDSPVNCLTFMPKYEVKNESGSWRMNKLRGPTVLVWDRRLQR
jgi:hypothetical protein